MRDCLVLQAGSIDLQAITSIERNYVLRVQAIMTIWQLYACSQHVNTKQTISRGQGRRHGLESGGNKKLCERSEQTFFFDPPLFVLVRGTKCLLLKESPAAAGGSLWVLFYFVGLKLSPFPISLRFSCTPCTPHLWKVGGYPPNSYGSAAPAWMPPFRSPPSTLSSQYVSIFIMYFT